MGKLIGIAVVVGGFLAWRHWRKLPSDQARRKFSFQAIVGGLLIVIVLLAITGRIHPLGAVFAALIPMIKIILNLLIRGFPLLARIYGANYAKPRTLKTAILEVEINFADGAVSGKVIEGDFAGERLEDLTEKQLQQLLAYCQQQDKKSAYLVRTYIASRFRDDNRANNQSGTQASSGSLSKEEAAEILGVTAEASEQDINQAHRRLIGKVHPDKGGSDYLASLLNRARDILLDK